MKAFVKISLSVIYLVIVLFAFGYNVDVLPFHVADVIVAMFAFGGVLYWADFGTEYIFKFIEWLKNRSSLK